MGAVDGSQRDGGGARFGFGGELLESTPPHRAVTTDGMRGTTVRAPSKSSFSPVMAGALLALAVTFRDADTRDALLVTGMTDGMGDQLRLAAGGDLG